MLKLIFSPLVLFAFSSVSSYLIWLLLPDGLYLDAGIRQRVAWETPLLVAAWAVFAFGFGWFVAGLPRVTANRVGTEPAQVYRVLKTGNLLATIAWLILVANTTRVYGMDGMLLSMRGFIRPEHIEGVTTWVHLSTLTVVAAFVFRANMVNQLERRRFLVQAMWGGALAVLRGVGSGERLSIFIPAVATLLGLVVIGRRQIVVRTLAVLAALALLLIGVFTVSELMRSYRAKIQDQTIDSGALSYSINRLLLYYASSVNAGSAMIEYSREDAYRQPFLLTTLNPAAQVLYRVPGSDILRGTASSSVGYHTLVQEGYRPSELTNIWGIASPFTEGHVWGFVYWIVWGFLSRIVWRKAMEKSQASWWLVSLVLVGAGMLDCGRILTIGSVHILLPLGVSLVLAFRSKAPMPLPARAVQRRNA